MRRRMLCAVLAAVLCFAFAVPVSATTPTTAGIYGLTTESGATVTPQNVSGGTVSSQSTTIDGTAVMFYPEVVKLSVTYSGLARVGAE